MVKKAIDARIPALIRNGAQTKERSFFVIVGDKARNQLPNLHYLMTAANLKMNKSVLWAYKHKLAGFTSHRKKREAKIKKEIKRGIREANDEDPFELFISLQNIRYVYYKETENILGNTYGMCILQDFEALTPNLLARTIETVEGGGIIVILLKSMKSLKQLYTLNMDIHSRYRTESHQDVVARFNERFILSLGACRNCLVVDDELNVLPISGGKNVKPLPPAEENAEDLLPHAQELKEVKESIRDVKPAGPLIEMSKTLDQAKALLTFLDAITEKSLRNTVTLTAGRGRGKSAALGLAIAGAVANGYSNIFVTSPSPENLKTLFEFIFKGFDALKYEEHMDYEIIQSTNPALNKAIVRVDIFRDHRQTIQYIQPNDSHVLGQAELVVIDEAAAIPLPVVRKLLGPYLVFIASTINGYEGTGRSLSLKLIQQLREQAAGKLTNAGDLAVADRDGKAVKTAKPQLDANVHGRSLNEVALEQPIRYAPGDPVEKWLNDLLCLDATVTKSSRVFENATLSVEDCDLYFVNRDALFSFHPVSEAFLHKMMALYVASHYKNSPNDLQLLSDAPAHQLYVLVPKPSQLAGESDEAFKRRSNKLPEPIVVLQIALEGEISKQSIRNSLSRGVRAGGDLIPWLMSQQFQDEEFAGLSGARVVRIATHPDFVNMGYGKRALELLNDYFEGKFTSLYEDNSVSSDSRFGLQKVTDDDFESASLLEDSVKVRSPDKVPPLLLGLAEKPPHFIHYLGVSFGLTPGLRKFWTKCGYVPVYLRQTANELTGEHTCVMLKTLQGREGQWLGEFSADFHKRMLNLFAYEFKKFTVFEGIFILDAAKRVYKDTRRVTPLSKEELDTIFSPFDLKRLESYANNLLDYHVIVDLVPTMARLYFTDRLRSNVEFSHIQAAILLGIGLQKKSLDTIQKELNIEMNQVMAMFGKIVRKLSNYFSKLLKEAVGKDIPQARDQAEIMDGDADDGEGNFRELDQTLEEELDEAKKEVMTKLSEKQKELIESLDLSKYEITDDVEFQGAQKAVEKSGVVSVKNPTKTAKRKTDSADAIYNEEMKALKKSKKKSKKSH